MKPSAYSELVASLNTPRGKFRSSSMSKDIFSEVEKQAQSVATARASWRGVLSLDIPTLGLGAVEYHLRAAKAHGDLEPVKFVKRVQVETEGFVPSERISEYKFKELYQRAPHTDPKVKETASRVKQLARYLLEKQTALVSFFSWGRGYQFYTSVIHPYERKDGRLW